MYVALKTIRINGNIIIKVCKGRIIMFNPIFCKSNTDSVFYLKVCGIRNKNIAVVWEGAIEYMLAKYFVDNLNECRLPKKIIRRNDSVFNGVTIKLLQTFKSSNKPQLGMRVYYLNQLRQVSLLRITCFYKPDVRPLNILVYRGGSNEGDSFFSRRKGIYSN